MSITVESVPDPGYDGRIVYWCYYRDGKRLGAVSEKANDNPDNEKPDGWRALIYRRDGASIVTELGLHESRELAEAAVLTWAKQNPEQTS